MKVPLSRPYVDQEIRDAVLKALDSEQYILGPECKALEAEFAAYLGTRHAVLTTSGTAAIQLVLEGLGVKPGDEIIVPSLTAFPTIEPLLHMGAVPVFAEIDESFTMNPDHAASLITPRTVGIIPVHLYGRPANIPALQALAKKHKLFLLEDTCQGHGAEIGSKRCGSFGVAGCFSFYPSKNMTVAGDGGLIATSDDSIAEKARMLRNHGRRGRYEHEVAGYNLRFNEIQAAVGRVQLRRLPGFVARRGAIARRYDELLKPLSDRLKLPTPPSDLGAGAVHSYHLYVVRTPRRDELKEFLAAQGVSAEIHYPIPCHLQPATAAKVKPKPLPFTEKVCGEILSLPMYPALEDKAVAYVAEQLGRFFAQKTARAA